MNFVIRERKKTKPIVDDFDDFDDSFEEDLSENERNFDDNNGMEIDKTDINGNKSDKNNENDENDGNDESDENENEIIINCEQKSMINDNEYFVEKIMDVREINGVLKYNIKWEGWPYSSNTWENEQNLTNCKQMLNDFKRNNGLLTDDELLNDD